MEESDQPGALLSALADLEARAKDRAGGWRLMLYAIILAPIALVAPRMFGRDAPLNLLGMGMRLSFGLAIICLWYGLSLRRSVRRALAQGSLAFSIAGGDLHEAELKRAVPWPWSNLLRSGTGIQATLQRAGNDLDWYVESDRRRSAGLPARHMFRAQWLYVPFSVLSAAFLEWRLPGTQLSRHLGLVLLLPLPFIYYRRQIWHEELAYYLREVLGRGPGSSE